MNILNYLKKIPGEINEHMIERQKPYKSHNGNYEDWYEERFVKLET